MSGLHGDCGIVGKNQTLSTSFNQVHFVLLDLWFSFSFPHVNWLRQLCSSCHRLLPLRFPGGTASVCLASTCPCVRLSHAVRVLYDLPRPLCMCVSRLWSGAAERPPVAAAYLASLPAQRAPWQDAGVTRESFLAELQDRQTNERTAASRGATVVVLLPWAPRLACGEKRVRGGVHSEWYDTTGQVPRNPLPHPVLC
jgi:hypothetical protein